MAVTQLQKDNLYKALGLFIEGFRPYLVSVLLKNFGEHWPAEYAQALFSAQKELWDNGLRQGASPEGMIDYPHLRSVTKRYYTLLQPDFGKETKNLGTNLDAIYGVRNKLAHFQELTDDEWTMAFIHIKNIARLIHMDELEAAVASLQESKSTQKPVSSEPRKHETGNSVDLQPWFRIAEPHMDIKQGRLDESIFAANLSEVALGNGREIYNNPVMFFSKTYFTAGLKSIAKTVIKGLNGSEDAENRVISLQTGFGGGKTHTLISLYHICKWGKKSISSSYVSDLLAYTGSPEFDSARIAVFTNATNDAANGRTTADGIHIQTIWGELAYQLGGSDAYEIVRKNDEQLIAPAGLFKKVLEQANPALILIDELADYCVKAAARKVGNSSLADQTISFMQELTEAVAATNHCVAVVTLPASPQEVGNTPEAQSILNSLQKRVSRVGADTQPVADDEIYEVIRRRLFEEIGDPVMIEAVASKYLDFYQKYKGELPSYASKSEFKQRVIKSYPFHPELIDIFRVRWASHHDFQRTRGVLRLLAAIVSDLWKRQQSLPGDNLLIQTGQVNLVNLDAVTGQLKRLYGNGYDAVITADVAGSSSNAFKIDNTKAEYGQWYLTQSIASVVLLSSFGSDGSNKGISVHDLKLQLLTPGGFNHNNINGALDDLESSAYYLYYSQLGAGKRYWFHTKPNINILINQARADIKNHDIEAEIIRRIKEKEKAIQAFNVLVDPSADIPEQQKPTLVILNPRHQATAGNINGQTKALIERIATKKGNSERIYRNTILFLICSEIGSTKLQADVRDYLACQKITSEYSGQLERDQKEEIKRRMDDASRQTGISITNAYSIVAKHSSKIGIENFVLTQFKESLDLQINATLLEQLKKEEWLLESVGLGTLRSNNLLPTPDRSVKVKDVYEAFLRFDDKPLITGVEAIARSVQKYCLNGEYGIATGDGIFFKRFYFKEQIPFFDPTDETYWMVHESLKPLAENTETPVTVYPTTGANPTAVVNEPPISESPTNNPVEVVKTLQSLEVSGKVSLEQYTELFGYFIKPFVLTGNGIEIEVKFKIKSNPTDPLHENKQQYKNAKEAARQLGLRFEED